jgi:DNA-binding ferritin-like protein
METTTGPALQEIRAYLITTLKGVLADEYVLMNKTASYLSDPSSPFLGHNTHKLFQKIYEELKRNAEAISVVLKRKTNDVFLSLNEIVVRTRIKKTEFFSSRVAAIEMLIRDHTTVIRFLEDVINEFAFTIETDCVELFKMLREAHTEICEQYHKVLKEIFSYRGNRFQKQN